MTGIVDAIDEWTTDRYDADYDINLFGLCELARKSAGGQEQPMPITMPDLNNTSHERIQVSLDDKYNFITWMRWIDSVNYEANEEWSFGKKEARLATIPLRLIIAHKVSLGENLVFDFINAFPSKFSVNGFQFVFIDGSPSIDPDHENIYLTELGKTVYEKHRFEWNIYALNLSVQFMQCEESVSSDFITDAFGNCLTS